MSGSRTQRGAAAVEFALIVPILVLLVFGIAEFGRAWFIQSSLAGAAREGAREMAISKNAAAAQTAAINAAPGFGLTAANVAVPGTCPAGTSVTVIVTYNFSFATGLFGSGFPLTGKGTMRCGG